jgi:hypothetical protein
MSIVYYHIHPKSINFEHLYFLVFELTYFVSLTLNPGSM